MPTPFPPDFADDGTLMYWPAAWDFRLARVASCLRNNDLLVPSPVHSSDTRRRSWELARACYAKGVQAGLTWAAAQSATRPVTVKTVRYVEDTGKAPTPTPSPDPDPICPGITEADFMRERQTFNAACVKVLAAKGQDYSSESNRLSNFTKSRTGLTPFQVWAVLFEKHVNAICRWIADSKLASEPIAGRLIDARNYLDLAYVMLPPAEQRPPKE